MDYELLTRRIVEVLYQHPAEWLTFRQLEFLMGGSECDENVIAGIADYRQDLFAQNNDRRIKLRDPVVKEIALQGFTQWQVPPRQEKPHLDPSGPTSRGTSGRGRYCDTAAEQVLRDLLEGTVPDEALMYTDSWKHICRVRANNLGKVPDDKWIEVCQRRGYLRARENPRGF